MSKKNNIGLTEDQVNELLHGQNIMDDDDNVIFRFVGKRFLSNDTEKSHVEFCVTIQDMSTGKKYKAVLGESPWYLQEKHNAKQKWEEVIPKKKNVKS